MEGEGCGKRWGAWRIYGSEACLSVERLISGDHFSSVFSVGFWKVFLPFFVDFSAIWEVFWETFRDLFEVYGILPDCTPSYTKTYFLRF